MSPATKPITGRTAARAVFPSSPFISEVLPRPQARAKVRFSDTTTLSICNFLSKGWEVSILGMLAFIHDKYNLSYSMVGILSTVFIVSQITVSFFAGKIAHAVHSRNVIFLSIAASAVSWLVLFFSGNVAVLFLAFAFGGLSSGLFEPIGNSLVAKLTPSANRGTAIGNFAAYGDMGRIAVMAAATALAGFLGVNGASGVLCVSALGALLLAGMYIPRSNGADDPETSEVPVHLKELVKNRKFCMATAAGIADSFSSASLYIWIPFLLTAKGISLANTLYFNVIFFTGYMSGRLLLGRLADRHGAPHILMASKLAMSALIVLLLVLNRRMEIVVLLYLLGVFTRGSSPIIRAMVADSIDDRVSFHNAFSAYSSASRGSTALCRPVAGFLASLAGVGAVFYMTAAVSLCTLYPAAKYKNLSAAAHTDEMNREGGLSGSD